MGPEHFTGFRTFIEAVASSSPIALLSTVRRRTSDEGGTARQMAIILIPSIITAMLTALATAWATQMVMAEQIREVKEQVVYNRDVTAASILRLQEQIYANRK